MSRDYNRGNGKKRPFVPSEDEVELLVGEELGAAQSGVRTAFEDVQYNFSEASDNESMGAAEDVLRDDDSLDQDAKAFPLLSNVHSPSSSEDSLGSSSGRRVRADSLSQDIHIDIRDTWPLSPQNGGPLSGCQGGRYYPPPPGFSVNGAGRKSAAASEPRIALIGMEGGELEQKKKSDTLGKMFLNLFWGASSRRTPAGMYDDFVGVLSSFLRSQVEEHTALLVPRLLQEPALWDLVNKVGSGTQGDGLEKPRHLKELSDLVGIEEGILTIIANNLVHSETLQSTPASDSYDQRNLVEPLAFLRSYGEPLLAPPLGVSRERHIKGEAQKLHTVCAQQTSSKSRSSRGSHVALYPHTEDGYKKTREISQAFLLVCVKRGTHTTPTHVISFQDIVHDMSLLRDVIAEKSKEQLSAEYYQRIGGAQSYGNEVLSVHERVFQEIQWQYEQRLQAEVFDHFEGPTMDKQRSTPFPILTKEHDLDGRAYITYRANLNIREKVNLANFNPDPLDPLSDPAYDEDVCRLWRHYTHNQATLDALFPEKIFGQISQKQKCDNLKLLLALRTKPKTAAGVEILRDLIWVFRTLHHDGADQKLYTDQYFMQDYAGLPIRRNRKAVPGAAQWQDGYAAMFRNKEVLHYRANFAEKFYVNADRTDQEIGREQAFFNRYFGEDAQEVQACFGNQITATLESEDEQVRFYKTYCNVIEYSEEMALALLFPHKLYKEFKAARGGMPMKAAIKSFLATKDVSENYHYLLESQSYAKVNLGRLQEMISGFENFIPQHVDAMMRYHSDIEGSEEYRVLRDKLSNVTSTKQRTDELRRESVTTRDARWLIRMYLKDADNNALPSYHIFQKHLLRRILGDGMLSSEVELGKYENLLLLKEIELAVERATQSQKSAGDISTGISDGMVQEVLRLKGVEYSIEAIAQGRKVIAAARFMFAETEGTRSSSYLGEEGLRPCESRLNIKNIVRFTHQLQQYQLGCKILGSELAAIYNADMQGFTELLFSEIRYFHQHHTLRDDNVLEKDRNHGGLGFTVSEIEVFLNITSTPGSEKFKQFIISNDTSNLTPFSLLDACTKMPEGLIDLSVLQDVGFATIINIQEYPHETRERYAVSVLDFHKKEILLEEDRLIKLKKCTYLALAKAGVVEELNKRSDFLRKVIDRSEANKMPGDYGVVSMTLEDINLRQRELDYKIERWYHAEYIDIRLDASESVVMSGNALSNKIVKMLRSRNIHAQFTPNIGLNTALLEIDAKEYVLHVNGDGEYSLSLARWNEVMQEYGFFTHQGVNGDSDRVVLERRPWFDEYDRGLITETEGVEVTDAIKALIAEKALLKTEVRRRDVEATKSSVPNMSDIELGTLIDHDLERIRFLLRATNDLRFNHAASIAEQGSVLDILVMGRAKQNDISRLTKSRLQKICDIAPVDTLNKKESSKVKFTRGQIAQLEEFLKGKFQQYDMVGKLSIFDTNKQLIFNCFSTDEYWASVEGLESLGIVANESGIFFPQNALTLKVREELLWRREDPNITVDNHIADYKRAVQDVWAVHGNPQPSLGDSRPSESLMTDLRALRRQKRNEYFDQVEFIGGEYRMSYEVGSLLIRKLNERGCHFDNTTQRIVFYYQDADEAIQESCVKIVSHEGFCAISSEGFEQLSLHCKLQYDEQKQSLYFAEKHLKTLGYAQSKLAISYDLSDYINDIYQDISALRSSVLDLNKMLYRSFIELYKNFSLLDGNNVVQGFNEKKMQRELNTLERQPKLGFDLIKRNIQAFVEGYLGRLGWDPIIQDDWKGHIYAWRLAIRDKVRAEAVDEGLGDESMESTEAEMLRFLDMVESWYQGRDYRGQMIKECKAKQAVIWESLGHPDFIPKTDVLAESVDDEMLESGAGRSDSWVANVLISSIKAEEVNAGK